MKKALRLFVRAVLILPAIVLQVLWYLMLLTWLSRFSTYLNLAILVFEVITVFVILNQRGESNYKLLWIIILFVAPFFGVWLYLASGNKRNSKPIIKRINKNNKENIVNLESENLDNNSVTNQTLNLIKNLSGMPIYETFNEKYYPLGENMFEDMLKELKQAKHFIFMEYFIIENGIFWNSIVEILKQKVKEGVTVKVLYDDIGSISTYSIRSKRQLEKAGIEIVSFNPLTVIKLTLNNRSHRKMLIIDNRVCFSGGVNIADEYINKIERFGHWKDIGFRLEGKAVLSYTHMFVLFWNAYSKNKIRFTDLPLQTESQNSQTNEITDLSERENILIGNENEQRTDSLRVSSSETKVNSLSNNANVLKINDLSTIENKGFVISYYDSPNNLEPISNKFFINILGSATKYAYFYTPYLILGDSLKEAFIQAVQRGIDVRIIIPGRPDKKLVYSLTKKYAEELACYGVRIFEYTAGFVHAKASIVDDRICSIGTVNLDYRSLHLNFENNSVFANAKILSVLKQDFLQTQENSKEIKREKIKKSYIKMIFRNILDIFSPWL